MSPFVSQKQARAAFGGFLGPELKAKAAQWEDETPGGIASLPERVPGSGHTRYRLSIDRKDSLPKQVTTKGGTPNMASNFTGKGTGKDAQKVAGGKAVPKGKRAK